MSIMIVDDSSTSRLLLATILKSSGYEDIIETPTGQACLEHIDAMARGDEPAVDLVLMDLHMPTLDGIETTRLLKAKEVAADLPVIIVTINDDAENLEKAFEAGAIDYINKPVSRVELSVRVRSVLKLKHEIDRRKARERELEALTQTLQELSNQDGLTGVPNRRYFDEMYTREWGASCRHKQPLSALMIDIDHFKAYNDSYGHLQGDVCLKEVAQTILNTIKRPGDFLARYGGEEFVVLLPNTDREGALKLGEDLRKNIENLGIEHSSSSTADVVTSSIGVAAIQPQHCDKAEALLDCADRALYSAKEKGRNRVVIYCD